MSQVVGSSSNLLQAQKGSEIDDHDAVFRVNFAPTEGFEKDVGSRLSYRVGGFEAGSGPETFTYIKDIKCIVLVDSRKKHVVAKILRRQVVKRTLPNAGHRW